MNDADRSQCRKVTDLEQPLPDDFIEFLALDLALSRERAQHALVELLQKYRPSKSLTQKMSPDVT